MTHFFITGILLITVIFKAHSQEEGSVGIGLSNPNAKAALDIYSTSKGVLIPRLTQTQRDAIAVNGTAQPDINGLMIFNTDEGKLNCWVVDKWVSLPTSGSGGGGLDVNIDRPISRPSLPGYGENLGAGGKTISQFIEEFFFPSTAATPPLSTFVVKPKSVFPYSEWKTWNGFSTNLDFDWTVTNKSKTDPTADKDITSIKLISGGSTITSATPLNTGTTESGTFTNIPFGNAGADLKQDFTKTYTLEVKDAQPNTVTKNVTVTMSKAVQLTYPAPTLSGSVVYEYSPSDQAITLNWGPIVRNDETISGIKVNGNDVGTDATGSTTVKLKSPVNGGTQSQTFALEVTGDLYGATSKNSPAVKWESYLYRGVYAGLPVGQTPCSSPGFTFSADDVKNTAYHSEKKLGGDWKNTAGYDFTAGGTDSFVWFAYPDDTRTPTVQYYSTTLQIWQTYPPNQLKIIDIPNFMNESGYNGINYKVVFVCVAYRGATVKLRLQ